MRAEHEAEKQLELKVARMLSHEIDVEKGIQILNKEIAHTVHDINKHLRGLETISSWTTCIGVGRHGDA